MDLNRFGPQLIASSKLIESGTRNEAWNIVTPGDPYDIRKFLSYYSDP